MAKATGEFLLIISFICKRTHEDVSFHYFYVSSPATPFSNILLIALYYIFFLFSFAVDIEDSN